MECWGEYFTSITNDQLIPSFQDFLNYWSFHKKYVFLFQQFNEIIPGELKLIEKAAQKSISSKSVKPVKNSLIKYLVPRILEMFKIWKILDLKKNL